MNKIEKPNESGYMEPPKSGVSGIQKAAVWFAIACIIGVFWYVSARFYMGFLR